MSKDKLMSPSLANAFILVAVSMIIGALFGLISGKMAGTLTSKAPA
jgi:ABC-type dipeptide/oligopeptide/nickel transport system permease subunit